MSYLNGISPDEILSSIEYYMEKVALSEDTVNMYISVIKEFFKYIKETQDIGNDKLIQSFGRGKNDVNSFTYKYKAYIKILLDNNKIKPSTKGVPFSEEHVNIIVQYCDEHLDIMNPIQKISYEILYNQYVKSLQIKLIAYLGVSLDVLNKITVQQFDISRGTIIISGYCLHLPFRLRQQMELFSTYALLNKEKQSPLFALYSGDVIKQPNKLGIFMNNRLKKVPNVENSSAITSLAKYAIIQLIDAGIDRDTIIELTGYKDEIYESCKQLIDKVDLGIKSKKLDNILKQLPSYDYL